jgi:hypothetical protein
MMRELYFQKPLFAANSLAELCELLGFGGAPAEEPLGYVAIVDEYDCFVLFSHKVLVA